jgi:hypothetical protein
MQNFVENNTTINMSIVANQTPFISALETYLIG